MSSHSSSHLSEVISAARRALHDLDPTLAQVHAIAPVFEWRVKQGGFAGLAQLIVEQQISVPAAAAIWSRLEAGLGHVTSAHVLASSPEKLKAFGLSNQKVKYIRAIAEAEVSDTIDFNALSRLDDVAAIATLDALPGVGRWTAEIYLMFCEGRMDLFPAGDLALQEAWRVAEKSTARLSEKALYARALSWQPHRGIAAHLLWAYYSAIKRGDVTATAHQPEIKPKVEKSTVKTAAKKMKPKAKSESL